MMRDCRFFVGGMFMFSYIWPIGLVVLSNVIYHVCAKSTPETMHPLASLTVTYAMGGHVGCSVLCSEQKRQPDSGVCPSELVSVCSRRRHCRPRSRFHIRI